MNSDSGVLRQISIRDLCPWAILLRAFSVAANPSIILLATGGVLLSMIGWNIFGFVFQVKGAIAEANVPHIERVIDDNHTSFRRIDDPFRSGLSHPLSAMSIQSNDGMPGVFWDYANSFKQTLSLFNSRMTLWQRIRVWLYFLCGGVFMLATWSIAAGAITRIAVMRLGREEGYGLKESVMYAVTRFGQYIGAPLLPLGAMVAFGFIVGLFSLLMLADWGVFLAGIVWFLALAVGFVIAFLGVFLMFGWPLMWPTISCENSDPFDAISRSYAYVLQRPLNFVFYVAICVIFGALCWWVVNLFGETVIHTTNWAASWGAQTGQMEQIARVQSGAVEPESASIRYGSNMIYFWQGLVRTVVEAFSYGLFWVFASAMYLLLRKDVDETEFDEIYVDGQQDYGLPPINNDSEVPQILKETSESPATEESTSEEVNKEENENPSAAASDSESTDPKVDIAEPKGESTTLESDDAVADESPNENEANDEES